MSSITIPHKFKPRDYQLPFLKAMDSGIKRAVLVWHRRSGKDKTAWNFMIKKAITEVGNYYYFLPTGALAKQVIWDNIDNDGFKTVEHCPEEIIRNKNETEMVIELINGSTIKLIGSDKFEKRAIGTNPRGVVFSEYSVTEPQVWNYVRPILAANEKAWAVFIFTPRGMNHGHKILQQARGSEHWFEQILTVDDTKAISPEALEEEKREMPEDLFFQEYHCKFVEGAGAFFRGVDDCLYLYEKEPINPADKYRLGADLAKYQDYTVLTAINLAGYLVHPQERFNQVDWQTQKASIEAFYRRYNQGMMWMDSTGLGDPVYDDLLSRGVNVEGFKFTEKTRMDLLNNLRILINDRKIKIPASEEQLIGELRSFQYSLTPQGRIKVQVPEGLHDDCVMSLALAVWELPPTQIKGESDPVKRLLNIKAQDYGTVGDDIE